MAGTLARSEVAVGAVPGHEVAAACHAPPGRPVPGGEAGAGPGAGPAQEAPAAGGRAQARPGRAALAGAARGGPRGRAPALAGRRGARPGLEGGPRGQEAEAAEEERGAGEGLAEPEGGPSRGPPVRGLQRTGFWGVV